MMPLLLTSLFAGAALLAGALFIVALLRTRSAALRHAILASALAVVAMMPLLDAAVPEISIAGWTADGLPSGAATVAVSGPAGGTTPTAAAEPVSWVAVVGWMWLAASVVLLTALLVDIVRLIRLRRRCVPAADAWRALTDALASSMGITRRIQVLQSTDPAILVAFGTLRPGIILPDGADDWPDDRRRIVLTHELAHIKRNDAAVQVAAELVRCLLPLNPLVWVACRRLRQESEHACDDAVLQAGVKPSTYGAHLLDLATSLKGRRAAWASAPAIAHPSTLERRVVAMLDHRRRTPLTVGGWTVVMLIALACSLPLAALSLEPDAFPVVPAPSGGPDLAQAPAPAPASAPASTSAPAPTPAPRPTPAPEPAAPVQAGAATGLVTDQTGGVIPGARITITDVATRADRTAISAANGRYTIGDLPAGDYELRVQLSGFRTTRAALRVPAGQTVDTPVTLAVGELTEAVSVVCSSSHARSLWQLFVPSLQAQAPMQPIRVGGHIRPPKKTRHVAPVCPAGVVTQDTVVIVQSTIGPDGTVTDASILKGPETLAGAALDAVRQWEFTPTQLNGQPIEVTMVVAVNFTVGR